MKYGVGNCYSNICPPFVIHICTLPPPLLFFQVCSVVAFSQTLRRYTSLNHLAQAARAVLQNPSQISQMLADLNRVDFANVQVREMHDTVGLTVFVVCVHIYTCSILEKFSHCNSIASAKNASLYG